MMSPEERHHDEPGHTASDIRFAGTDERLLHVARLYGVDTSLLDTRTLPDAVAAAVRARGLSDHFVLSELFCSLLLSAAKPPSVDVPPPTRRGGLPEAVARRRLQRLYEALVAQHGASAVPAYKHPGAGRKQARRGAMKAVFERVASLEGKCPDRIRKWCRQDAEARRLVHYLRPLVLSPFVTVPQRRGAYRRR